MNAGEALRSGLVEIRTNKFRSVLSFAAVSVGVASLLYTLAQTRGMQEEIAKAIAILGPGRITVSAKQDYVSQGLSKGLTLEDASAIRRAMPWLYMVSPTVQGWGARFEASGQRFDRAQVLGITPEWRRRDWVFKLRGRFFNDWDISHAARVCVVIEPGGWFKKPFWAAFWSREEPIDDFLAHHDLLGKAVRIEEHLFTVVGVLKEPPKDLDPRWFHWGQSSVMIPATAFHRYLGTQGSEAKSSSGVDEITLDTGSAASVKRAKKEITALLKRRHRQEEDFELKDLREEIEGELEESKKYLIAAIVMGGVALFAGGIGIMNVMLATVFARTKEIGIRRACGATKADITAQFVIEAGLLGLAGGVAGLGLGLWGIDFLAKHTDRAIAKFAWHHGLAGMAVAVLVAVVFALAPAARASRLDPVEALRSE